MPSPVVLRGPKHEQSARFESGTAAVRDASAAAEWLDPAGASAELARVGSLAGGSQSDGARWDVGLAALARRPSNLICAALLVAFVALVGSAGSHKSEILDESSVIASGALLLHEHGPRAPGPAAQPPLARWAAGLGATVVGGAELPADAPEAADPAAPLSSWARQPLLRWSAELLYAPAHDKDRVLSGARLPFALLGALLGLLVFVEARRRFGSLAGLCALGLCLFTPELLAQAQWAGPHVLIALGALLVASALARCLEQPSRRTAIWLGAALGLAMLAETGFALLAPWLLAAAAWKAARVSPRPGWQSAGGQAAWIGLAAWAVLVAGHLPRVDLWPPHTFALSDVATLVGASADSTLSLGSAAVLRWLPLPEAFIRGLIDWGLDGARGHLGFFHGQVRIGGFPHYLPTAVFLKYPTALIVLALGGLAALLRSAALSTERKLAWTVLPAGLFAVVLVHRSHDGVRAVLFLVPFFALWSAAAVAWARARWTRLGALGLVTLAMWAGVRSYPHFSGYFHPLFGGTARAHDWLAGPDLDAGQDLPELARTLRAKKLATVRLAYHGSARPEHWQIPAADPYLQAPGWYAISRTALAGYWPPGDPFAWLRQLEPVKIVGSSMALFHVEPHHLAALPSAHRDDDPAKLMSSALAQLGRPDGARHGLDRLLAITATKPDHYGARFQSAAALAQLGESGAAMVLYAFCMADARNARDTATAELIRARIQQHYGRDDPGDEPAMEDAAKRSADPAALMKRATAARQRRAPLEAVVELTQLLRLKPDHYGARFQLAAALDQAERPRAALAAWRQFLRVAVQQQTASPVVALSEQPYVLSAWQRVAELEHSLRGRSIVAPPVREPRDGRPPTRAPAPRP